MKVVIDANVFQAYFQMNLHGTLPPVTGDPSNLFERILLGAVRITFDDADHIKTEWESVVEREWFSRWFRQLFIDGDVHLVTIVPCTFISHLQKFGFPRGKDIRYLQVSMASTSAEDPVYLVTEDMDFFDPPHKASGLATRDRIKKNGSTSITNFLRKKQDIHVLCISNALLV
jgi:hypothetical protein